MTRPKFKPGDEVTVTSLPGYRSSVGHIPNGKVVPGDHGVVSNVIPESDVPLCYVVRISFGSTWYFSARNLKHRE